MTEEYPEQALDLLRAEVARQPADEQMDRWAVERALARLNRRGPVPRPWWRPMRWAWVPAVGVLLVTAAVSAKLWSSRPTPATTSDARVVAAAAAAPLPRPRPRPAAAEPRAVASIPVEARRETDGTSDQVPSSRRPVQQTAASLFDRARDLAREGKSDAAIATHLRLQRRFPETPEAALSFALSGRLLLERGRAAAALAQFDRHLALGGAADEEALAGRAASLQQLGRQTDEVGAWQRLLDRHPGSVYADRAAVRLRDLSAR